MNGEMTKRQREAWCLSALSVSAVMLLSGLCWIWVLAGSAAAALLRWLTVRLGGVDLAKKTERAFGRVPGGILLLLGAGWTALVLARAARAAGDAYPDDGVETLSAVVLLALAVLSRWKGEQTGVRAAGLLAMFLTILYSILLLSAAGEIDWTWCGLWGGAEQAIMAFGVGLLPMAALWLPGSEKPSIKGAVIQTLAPTFAALATVGMISPGVARQEAMPFYTAAKSLSLLSVLERVEPLVSGALMLGFFCAASLLLNTAAAMICTALPKADGKWTGLAVGALALGLSRFTGRLPQIVWVAGSVVFWGILPLATLWIVELKKDSKIAKKRVDKRDKRGYNDQAF